MVISKKIYLGIGIAVILIAIAIWKRKAIGKVLGIAPNSSPRYSNPNTVSDSQNRTASKSFPIDAIVNQYEKDYLILRIMDKVRLKYPQVTSDQIIEVKNTLLQFNKRELTMILNANPNEKVISGQISNQKKYCTLFEWTGDFWGCLSQLFG